MENTTKSSRATPHKVKMFAFHSNNVYIKKRHSKKSGYEKSSKFNKMIYGDKKFKCNDLDIKIIF